MGIGFIASVLFGFMAFLVRVASKDVPYSVIVFIRASGGALVFIILYIFKLISFHPVNRKLLFLRSFLGAIALMLWFYSISSISLSKAVFYLYSYPLYTALFSILFYREKIYIEQVVGMLSVIMGLISLSGFWAFDFNIKDTLGILSGFFAGFAMSVLHRVRKTDEPWTIVIFFLVISSFVSIPFAITKFSFFNIQTWSLLIFIVVIATTGQVLMTYSYKYCSAVQGSIVSSTSVVFPAVLGSFLLGEVMTGSTFIGGFLIIAGGIVSSIKFRKENS